MRNHHTRDRPRSWLSLLTLVLALVALFVAARPVELGEVSLADTPAVLAVAGVDELTAVAGPVHDLVVAAAVASVGNLLNVLAIVALAVVVLAATRPYRGGVGLPSQLRRFDTYANGRSFAATGGAST